VAARDFTNYRVFDRLQLYERRIELSLYKAMREFQRLTLTPKSKRPEDPRTERQTHELKKQTQFASPSSLPEQQPTPSDDVSFLRKQESRLSDAPGSHPESAVTADQPRSTECDYAKQTQFSKRSGDPARDRPLPSFGAGPATRNPQLVTRNPQMTPHLKKQSQFAGCQNECKPNSNKALPQAATAPTPAKTNPIGPNFKGEKNPAAPDTSR
jgi:hypothetical protein